MNTKEKKVAFTILFEKNKTPDFVCEFSQYSDKVDICGKGYITFVCNTTEFKEFLKNLPNTCKTLDTEVKLYGRVMTDKNNCTYFNYSIDGFGIEMGEAQVISKTPGCNIPLSESDSIGSPEKKEEVVCY